MIKNKKQFCRLLLLWVMAYFNINKEEIRK